MRQPDITTVVIYFNVEIMWALEVVGAGVPLILKHVWEAISPEVVDEQSEYVETGNFTSSGPYVLDSHKEGEWWLLRKKPYFFRRLVGDVDASGNVNIVDVTLVAKDYSKKVPPANALSDQNGDELINIVDITIVAKNYGRATQ